MLQFFTQQPNVLNAGSSPLQSLLSKFPGGGEVVLRYDITGSNNNIWLSQAIGNDRYITYRMYVGSAMTAGNEWLSLQTKRVDKLYAGYNDQSTPAVSLNGAGWTVLAGTYPGGRLMYHATATRYAELVTPSGTTHVGAITNVSSNGGLALVTIDGDATLATDLPTAQQLVDAGTYANTILVANGGTLNPTDRCWDCYNRTNNAQILPAYNAYNFTSFASSLTAGAHTVRLTVTGYKPAASANANVVIYEICAFGSGIGNTATALTTRAVFIADTNVYDITSTFPRDEISYNTKPTGASGYEWIGHTGSLKIISAPAITVDGSSQSLTDNAQYTGSEIILTQQLGARHTEIGGGATNIGVLDLTYKLNATTGLTISHSMAWAMAGVAVGYPGMMAVNHAVMDRFQSIGSGQAAKDLTNNDDSRNLITDQQALYCWDYDGYVAAMMYIPDLTATVEDWAKSGGTNKFDWRDISANSGTWKKAYPNRFNSDEAFTDATVWTSEINYRAMWFSDGANNNLS